MSWRCVYGEPFPHHADFATEVEAHEFALRVSREEGCEVAVIEVGGPCEHDTLGCGWREPHEEHAKVGDGRPCCGWPPRCKSNQGGIQ